MGPEPGEQKIVELTPYQVKSTKRFEKQYVIAPGDTIEVYVAQNPGVSRQTQVRPDGKISLPLLGDIHAAGKTFPGLASVLTQAYSGRLKDPEVNVIAVDVQSPMVYVIGDVTAPQPVSLRQARTAAHAIGATGGFRREAAPQEVALIRLEEDGRLVATTIGNLTEGDSGILLSLQQVSLKADDIIYVPEGKRSKARRFIDDFINLPLSGINSMLSIYTNYLLTDSINTQNKILEQSLR